MTACQIHLLLHISPHHSSCLHSQHLSLPQPFTPHLRPICSTGLFFWFNPDCLHDSGLGLNSMPTLAFVCINLVTCSRLSWAHQQFFSPRFKLSLGCVKSYCITSKTLISNLLKQTRFCQHFPSKNPTQHRHNSAACHNRPAQKDFIK